MIFDTVPLWGFFLLTVGFVFLCIEGGFRLGLKPRQNKAERESSVSGMARATAGLLAFMLAFTFGSAASRHDVRKNLVIEETNLISTTYLRTALLPSPYQEETRRLLLDYVDLRVKAAKMTMAEIPQALAQSDALQDQLWAQAVAAAQDNQNSSKTGIFIQSLNELFELHLKRVTAAFVNRIPGTIWSTLYLLAALTMFIMGYRDGLEGARSRLISLVFVLSFSAVMFLIVDLDSPQQGLIRVSQQAMVDLQSKLVKDMASLAPGQKQAKEPEKR